MHIETHLLPKLRTKSRNSRTVKSRSKSSRTWRIKLKSWEPFFLSLPFLFRNASHCYLVELKGAHEHWKESLKFEPIERKSKVARQRRRGWLGKNKTVACLKFRRRRRRKNEPLLFLFKLFQLCQTQAKAKIIIPMARGLSSRFDFLEIFGSSSFQPTMKRLFSFSLFFLSFLLNNFPIIRNGKIEQSQRFGAEASLVIGWLVIRFFSLSLFLFGSELVNLSRSSHLELPCLFFPLSKSSILLLPTRVRACSHVHSPSFDFRATQAW